MHHILHNVGSVLNFVCS